MTRFGSTDVYTPHDLVASLLQGGYGEDVFGGMDLDIDMGGASNGGGGIDMGWGMFGLDVGERDS